MVAIDMNSKERMVNPQGDSVINLSSKAVLLNDFLFSYFDMIYRKLEKSRLSLT